MALKACFGIKITLYRIVLQSYNDYVASLVKLHHDLYRYEGYISMLLYGVLVNLDGVLLQPPYTYGLNQQCVKAMMRSQNFLSDSESLSFIIHTIRCSLDNVNKKQEKFIYACEQFLMFRVPSDGA